MMARLYLFSRLGGGDPEALGRSGERSRYASMGGVLLGTASVATISMFFALHHAVGAPVGWAIPLALGWGLLILTIDRFLVITMNTTRGRPIMAIVMVLLRLILAGLIATVVSMPLVLQIFASDINAELPIIAAQKSAQYNTKLANTALAQEIASLKKQVASEQAVANGTTSSPVTYYQGQVNSLNGQIASEQKKADQADLLYECELNGQKGATELCPPGTTGKTGNGPHAQADFNAWQADLTTVTSLQGQLAEAKSALTSAEKSQGGTVSTAQQALAQDQAKLTKLQQQYSNDVLNDENQNKADNGLLAQIQALFEASSQNSGLNIAHWAVTALFFVIELLPVAVKAMLLLGAESLHDRIVRMREEAAIDEEQRSIDAAREEQEAAVADVRRVRQSAREDIDRERQASRNRQDAEYDALLSIRQRDLHRDRVIADGKAKTLEDSAADMQQRDAENRRKINEQVAEESHNYATGIVATWAAAIHDKFRTVRGAGGDPGGGTANGNDPNGAEPSMGPNGTNGPNGNGTAPDGGHHESRLPYTEEFRIPGYTTPDGSDDII